MKHEYEKEPLVAVSALAGVSRGWRDISDRLSGELGRGARRLAIECYPGVFESEIAEALREVTPGLRMFRTSEALLKPAQIDLLIARDLTDDPVFGRLSGMRMREFFDEQRLTQIRDEVTSASGPTIVLGIGAVLASTDADLVIYADMPRWEIQMRQRSGQIGNLGAENENERPALKYKRGSFSIGARRTG